MAFKLPSFGKPSGPKMPGSKTSPIKKIQRYMEKMPYHYWIIIAGVVSLLLALALYFTLDDSEDKKIEEKPEVQMVTVVAADTDINARSLINAKMLKVIEMPEGSVPEGAITSKDRIINLPAAVQIMKGDIITDKKVLADPKMAGFTGTIPADCRAISVSISDDTGVAGFAKPGDYVDLMLVTGDKSTDKVNTKIVLQNVLLLGINKSGPANEKAQGSNNESADNGGKDKKSDDNSGNIKAAKEAMATATIAVTPTQAMQVAAAAQKGKIYLILRPMMPRDKFVFDTSYTTYNEIGKKGATEPKAPAAPAPKMAPAPRPAAPQSAAPAKPSGSIEVIRGTDTTREGR